MAAYISSFCLLILLPWAARASASFAFTSATCVLAANANVLLLIVCAFSVSSASFCLVSSLTLRLTASLFTPETSGIALFASSILPGTPCNSRLISTFFAPAIFRYSSTEYWLVPLGIRSTSVSPTSSGLPLITSSSETSPHTSSRIFRRWSQGSSSAKYAGIVNVFIFSASPPKPNSAAMYSFSLVGTPSRK